MFEEYVSLDEAAAYNDTSVRALQKLRFQDKKVKRTCRFKDDKVLLNYKKPLEFVISDLYYKAVFIAGSERSLAFEIAPTLKMKKESAYAYLHRFNFKHFKKANELKNALETYCNNSIWCVDDGNGKREFIA